MHKLLNLLSIIWFLIHIRLYLQTPKPSPAFPDSSPTDEFNLVETVCISSGSVKSHDIISQYNYFLPSDFKVGNIAESSTMTPKGNTQTEVTAGKGEYLLRTDWVINKIAIDWVV